MLPISRQIVARRCGAAAPALSTRQFHASTRLQRTDNPVPANDPNPRKPHSPVSSTNTLPTSSKGSFDKALQESVSEGEKMREMQAPNRAATWSRSQRPREQAMVGPRFEQTIMEDQPRPLSAMELIHQQPVHWTKERKVSCDGGGGPLGHPRIFINVDKPQICFCTYCGLPYAHEKHRSFIETLPHHSYPLDPTGGAAEVPKVDSATGQSNTGAPFEHR